MMGFKQGTKRIIKIFLCHILYYTGALHLFLKSVFLRKKRFSAVIINFHSFGSRLYQRIDPGAEVNLPVEKLEQMITFMEKYFSFLSLDEVVNSLKDGRMFDKPTVALTVDDGFKDNYDVLYPCLKKRNISATIFLSTGVVQTHNKLWPDRLLEALSLTQQDLLEYSRKGITRTCRLSSFQDKRLAYLELVDMLKKMSNEERLSELSVIEKKLHYVPSEDVTMLNWDQVREMSQNNISFGAHTVTHPILSRMPPDMAQKEILESKETIEKEIGRRIKHFAFPNGQHEDFTQELVAYCQEIGFESISSTTAGSNSKREDCWMLKRICPCWPLSVFAVYLLKAFYKTS